MRLLEPLRVGSFRKLAVSYTVNETGDSLAVVALAVLVYDRTRDPLATASLFVAMKFLPALLAPLLIARVDRMRPSRVLPMLYVVEAAAFAALAALVDSFFLPLVLALAFVDGILALTGRAITRAGIGAVLEGRPGLLRDGNALVNLGFALASVGGAAAGGLLTAGAGVQIALLVDAASFLIAAAITARLDIPAAPPEALTKVRQRVREGFAQVRAHPTVRLLMIGQSIALVFFTLIVPIEVVYAKETLDAGSRGFGALLAVWGIGITIGSALFLVLRRRSLIAVVAVSTAAVGAAYLGMSAARELWVACAFSIVGGMGNGMQWISVVTTVQEAVPVALHARVVGLLESLGAAMPGIGFLLGGVLTAVFSPPATFAIAGAGTLVLLAAGAPLLARAGRAVATA